MVEACLSPAAGWQPPAALMFMRCCQQAAFARTLPTVSSGRVGVWGSSYGGTITLMALFKHPGTFNAGVAAAPATDAAFFGSDDVAVVRRPSAARGEPDENYERCAPLLSACCTHEQRCQTTSASSVCVCRNRNSPMTFSAGLSDPLLLIHGMQDDVVPFKTTMVLMERLMEQGNHCFGA